MVLSCSLLYHRRRMVPKMMAMLGAKKKKYDEEICKRKRKLHESRAKAKRLKDMKVVAAFAEKTALRAASEEEAEREASCESAPQVVRYSGIDRNFAY